MTPAQRKNFMRLLEPRHIAVIGGQEAAHVIRENQRIGFSGEIWPVNPKREDLGGIACFREVKDLPEAPDAVFVAVPKQAVIGVAEDLRQMGAGGMVCYTAGFGELGTEGKALERDLVTAVGETALIGPNCYGVINYLHRAALWPFEHRGDCPGWGAAIVTQSGMMSSDITMNQRHLPLTHMISAGNQAGVQLEDCIDMLCRQESVRAIGLHIEGLRDIAAFAAAAQTARQHDTPIVAFKTGTSQIGAALTMSHTGSLSGEAQLYQALFDRLGIIHTDNLVQMLETLKFVTIAGLPRGNRLMGFTCSGGGATMIADTCESVGVELPPVPPDTAQSLRPLLPEIATISNPLDYTTPIWGMQDKTEPVFRTAIGSAIDAAILIQDFPHPDFPEIRQSYLNDSKAFVAAARDRDVAAMVCCTLPENIDVDTREFLLTSGVAPMQGLPEAIRALQTASLCHQRHEQMSRMPPRPLLRGIKDAEVSSIDESRAKQILRDAGLPVTQGQNIGNDRQEAEKAAAVLGFPLALKINSAEIAHKTDVGGVVLNIKDNAALYDALQQIDDNIGKHCPDAARDGFLLEQMAPSPVAELLVSIRQDAQFGLAMVLASGGVWVELLKDAVTLLLPCEADDFAHALARLKIAPLFDGFRGQPPADMAKLIACLQALAAFACDNRDNIFEIEINPLFVGTDNVCIVDIVMQLRTE